MIKTLETHPNHPTVGQFFDAYDDKVYYCDSYDSSCGFWMTEYGNPDNRKNISETAIGRTFHVIHVLGDGTGFSQFRLNISVKDIPRIDFVWISHMRDLTAR